MEALYFLKFWRPTTSISQQNQPTSPNTTIVVNTDDEEAEDSFFELELTLPDDDTTINNTNFDFMSNKPDFARDNIQPNELLSKRKILPIEPISKPHSPSTSSLKSAPGFKVLMSKKSKSMTSLKPKKTGHAHVNTSNKNKQEKKYFSLNFKLEEAVNIPVLARDNSLRRKCSEDFLSDDSSKKLPVHVLHKYLNLMKPLYVKVMRKQHTEKGRFCGELTSETSPLSTPALENANRRKHGDIPFGVRVVCKHHGKRKSGSMVTGDLPRGGVSRRDDSLLVQNDGI